VGDAASVGGRGAQAPRDLVVVSDLHLGRGFKPSTRRYHRLETFFYDDDFRSFCRWLCREAAGRGVPFTLVMAGDVFDLLRIEPEPVPGARGVERRFGPPMTAALAARLVADVLAGHPVFPEALADVLDAGHEVVLLPGNHDAELQWPPVQDEVRRAVAERLAARGEGSGAAERLRFQPWFHHEPGRIWIEHGCQYDPENAFRYHLRSGLPASPEAATVVERDMPFGNFFQKYLYNAFGSINFIVPSSRANYRYFRFLLANRPRLLLAVTRSHGPFMVELLRRLARAPVTGWQREAERIHAAELAELGLRSGLEEKLAAVDALKSVGADAARAASGIVRQATKIALGVALVAFAAAAIWAAAWRALDALMVGFGWKALLSLVLYLVFGAAGLAALVAAVMRMPRDEPPRPLKAAAERIAGILDVPLVVFGHTHDEVASPIAGAGGKAAWYFNTGTWIAVFTDDVLVPRERVQYTFLRVRGADAELLQWSPGRGCAMPVVLLEESRREEPGA
jgi:UDP-2,3-diacylglucosamine pyrophosphatase LpxH